MRLDDDHLTALREWPIDARVKVDALIAPTSATGLATYGAVAGTRCGYVRARGAAIAGLLIATALSAGAAGILPKSSRSLSNDSAPTDVTD